MEIRLVPPYLQNHKSKLNLKDESVIETVRNPDSYDDYYLENSSQHRIYLKRIPGTKNDLHLLVLGILFDGYVEVIGGYKIYPDLCESFEQKRKLELLSIIADRFGLDVTVGADTSKFHFFKRVSLDAHQLQTRVDPDGSTSYNFLSIHIKPETDSFQQMSFKPVKENGKDFIDCAIVFCLDMNKYLKWIQSH